MRSLRTLGQAAAVTPSSVPRWLLPRAHWKQLLDMQRDWLTHDLMESKEPAHAIFRTINQELGMSAGRSPSSYDDRSVAR